MKGIYSKRELECTQAKLQELEKAFAQAQSEPVENPTVRQWTLRSLKKRINQFKEEIARFQAAVAKPQ